MIEMLNEFLTIYNYIIIFIYVTCAVPVSPVHISITPKHHRVAEDFLAEPVVQLSGHGGQPVVFLRLGRRPPGRSRRSRLQPAARHQRAGRHSRIRLAHCATNSVHLDTSVSSSRI